MDTQTHLQALVQFLNQSPSQYHATESAAEMLRQHGFTELQLTEAWHVQPGGKYFVQRNQSALFAFVLGTGKLADYGIRMVAAHTDSPGFKLKTRSEFTASGNYRKLNTEVYGGPILHTWLDRPLSVAGRVSLRSDNPLWPNNRLVRIDEPLLVIPNLAIHMQREVNDGKAYNPQTELLPLFGQADQGEGFMHILARELDCKPEDILDYDLHLFELEPAQLVGGAKEFISSGRLDNLAMIHAGLTALVQARPQTATQLMICFDNEEIGSQTKQGAGSTVLRQLVERLVELQGGSREDYHRALYQSFMVSADMAHAVHPNYPEKHDPVNRPEMNRGPVIKIHGAQKYTSDADSVAVFEMVCQKAGVPYQKFVNRSDMRSGGTLGSISSAQLDVRSVDIGNPMLAMHSVRELAGTADHAYLIQALTYFYAEV